LKRNFLRKNILKELLLCCAWISCIQNIYAQKNLTQLSHFTFSTGNSCAGVWYYVDSLNREYALVGTRLGLAIVDVTMPASPVQLFLVPGINSNWREVRTWGNFAYVTTEGMNLTDSTQNGLQIVNLSYLPDSVQVKIWKGDGAITNQLQKAHSVNVDAGYVYINGSNLASGGVVIAGLADPWNPHYVGEFNDGYVHDSFVRGDTLWASALTAGFYVVNISDRSNPVTITSQPTPFNFNHNGWLSDDSKYFFTTDEIHNAPLASFEVSNISNITLLDTYRCINMDSFEVHNVRVINDFLICPSYGSQVTIVDAKRPANLVETASFTTGTGLCWDAIPFLPSGIILATDKANGLFVISPNYIHACWLEGTIKDSLTNQAISNAEVEILTTPASAMSNFIGNYKTGIADAGIYCVQISASGYSAKVISNVTLVNDEVTVLNVKLSNNASSLECGESKLTGNVYPNPVSSSATIRLIGFTAAEENIFLLYNAVGKKMREEKISNASEFIFHRDKLPEGIYFYRITNNLSVATTGKIVID
jgi:choice-of-anchor B domain-containing protein